MTSRPSQEMTRLKRNIHHHTASALKKGVLPQTITDDSSPVSRFSSDFACDPYVISFPDSKSISADRE